MAGNVMKVLIVDDIPETREILRKLLSFETDIEVIGAAGTGIEAIAFVREFKPDIVLMDINMPDMDGIAATEEIKKIHPAVGVIIMSAQSESGYLRRAMQAGARDFITKPISGEVLYETIQRVYSSQEQGRAKISTSAMPEKQPDVEHTGRILAVFSPQGGAGVTTIATNLAISLMNEGAQVLLVDADLQWGDVGIFLNLASKYTINNLADAIDELDQQLLDSIVISHPSGLKVLLAPHTLEDAERITLTDLPIIVQKMAKFYDYLIVDMPKYLDSTALSIMDLAERIILVGTPTLPCIRSTRRALNLFLTLDYPAEKIVFVVNRTTIDTRGRATIPIDAIESNLKRKVDARIPLDEPSFLSAVNQGVSVITAEPTKSPAIDLLQLRNKVQQSLSSGEEIAVPLESAVSRSRLGTLWSGLKG